MGGHRTDRAGGRAGRCHRAGARVSRLPGGGADDGARVHGLGVVRRYVAVLRLRGPHRGADRVGHRFPGRGPDLPRGLQRQGRDDRGDDLDHGGGRHRDWHRGVPHRHLRIAVRGDPAGAARCDEAHPAAQRRPGRGPARSARRPGGPRRPRAGRLGPLPHEEVPHDERNANTRPTGAGRALQPARDRSEVAGALGSRRAVPHAGRRPAAEVVRAHDVAVHVGRSPRGTLVRDGAIGRERALQADARLQRALPDGLRCVRPACRERRHQERTPPVGVDVRERRTHARAVEVDGRDVRLEPRSDDGIAGLLQVDAVVVPAAAEARPGVQEEGGGLVVPEGSDRARERAGRRREVRALRQRRLEARPGAVVLPHHEVRRGAAGLLKAPVERADRVDAAQLDRQERRRRAAVRAGRAGRRDERDPRLHDAAGYGVRRVVLRRRAGALARRADHDARTARRRARVRRGGATRERHRAHVDRAGEDRRLHRRLRDQPLQR